MMKLFRCSVLMSQLRINVLDSEGVPIVVKKQDMHGTDYMETVEKTYRKGDEISLPEAYITKLGKSVEVVMVPQVDEPVVEDVAVPADGEIRESGTEKTVADMIPKDVPKKAALGREPPSKGKK